MIHLIYPHKLNNQFKVTTPKLTDFVIQFNGKKTLLKKNNDKCNLPHLEELLNAENKDIRDFQGHYLFQIDEQGVFLEEDFSSKSFANFEYKENRYFRTMEPLERMAGITAVHIAHWEFLNQFCGKCGTKTQKSSMERALICPECHNIIYPKISPVVIVAVHNGNKLLMAKNRDNPNPRLFLISGFVEIGESLEEACHREVFEEVGIHIKNLKYFGSQPWAFSDSIIAGFTAELDGCETLHIQQSELSHAEWVLRENIPEYETDVSISCCLIENFRRGFSLKG